MPTDSYDLIYFNAPGRAEAIRLMFYAAGIEFNDRRCGSKEWSKLKEEMPLGAIPVLKINGVPYGQSTSLARYAARLSGYYPDDLVEALAVDEAMEGLNELLTLFPFQAESEEEKKRIRREFQKTVMAKYADCAESKIQRAGGSSFASTPNAADVWLMVQVQVLSTGMVDYIDRDFYSKDRYPGIIATCEAIKKTLLSNEKVASYMESSDFWNK